MPYLVVVAHPDDEVLGAGATIYKLTQMGQAVDVCVLCGQAMARSCRPSDELLQVDTNRCMKLLGIRRVYLGDFPNIEFNTVPHIKLVQFIEKILEESGATTVFTHHPFDLNNDHLHTSLACQAAVRLFQRRDNIPPVEQLFYMEVPSATEWGLNHGLNQFQPNTFFEVGKIGVEQKILALSQYRGVMRPYPHPRSAEVLEGLAAYRGSQSGCCYAEAFQCVFRRIVL